MSERLVPNEKHGVIFALWDGRCIQLEKRLTPDKFQNYTIIPGGGVKDGESPDVAEFREILEEYGVVLKKSIKLGTITLQEEGNPIDIKHVYLVTDWSGELVNPEGKNDHIKATIGEAKTLCEHPLSKLILDMVENKLNEII